MKRILFPLLFALLALASSAQTPYLVKDLNSIRSANAGSSAPRDFFSFDSRVLLWTQPFSSSFRLYATDGTSAGTVFLAGSDSEIATDPSRRAILDGKLLFNGYDYRSGEELWISDGTPAGTRMLADIFFNGSSRPSGRAVLNGKMLFAAYEDVYGRELWITDGTPAGTRFFKDLKPGPASSDPQSLVVMNGMIYFVTEDSLWRSDGTEAGTVIIKTGIGPDQLTVAGSRLFFSGYTESTGTELWVSDGTEAGTRMVADLAPGNPDLARSAGLASFGERVLFYATNAQSRYEPWVSDGTAAGTHKLAHGAPGNEYLFTSSWPFTVAGSRAYFLAETQATGIELWVTDGTEAGTRMLPEGVPGPESSSVGALSPAGEVLYFTAYERGGTSAVLWRTDGTDAGTKRVPLTNPPAWGSTLHFLNNQLYFSGANTLNGFEPWRSDGTDAGTFMIANLAADGAPSAMPSRLTVAGDQLFFNAWDGTRAAVSSGIYPFSLWRTDGTPEGTIELDESPAYESVVVGRSVLFKRQEQWWMSDGTIEGTAEATEFTSRFGSRPYFLQVAGEVIFAQADQKLWGTRFSAASPIEDLGTEYGSGFGEIAGRSFYLGSRQYSHRDDLVASDGTAAGTYPIARGFNTGSAYSTVMGGMYFFIESDTRKLWRSDGTPEGTIVLKQPARTSGEKLVAAGRNVYFQVNDDLWATDGTVAGTRALPLNPEAGVVPVGDRIIFIKNDSVYGRELWTSDGTTEGTRLLRDINPGALNGAVAELTSAGAYAFFNATDPVHGREPWITDGTPEGTQLLGDIVPEGGSSYVRSFARMGERVFFDATTPETGTELWAAALPPAVRMSVADVRVTEGNLPGTMARFTVRLSSAATKTTTVEYTTTDLTATAGSDYSTTSGTVTFNAGELTKPIDVTILTDGTLEGNESFFLTLRNPLNAMLEDASAFAVIEDDDRPADIGLSLDFSSLSSSHVRFVTENHGPAIATNVLRTITIVPGGNYCQDCEDPKQLAPDEKTEAGVSRTTFGVQQYQVATAQARERDPNPANNSIGWTFKDSMALDALWLTPESQGTIWFYIYGNPASATIESSNPAVVSVPASMTLPGTDEEASFIAHAHALGTATIKVSSGTRVATLDVDVLAPGARRRWPGAFSSTPLNGGFRFDETAWMRLETNAVAPFTTSHATGRVTIRANGVAVAQATLTPEQRTYVIPFHLVDIGANAVTIEYEGDANFLPQTSQRTINASLGKVSVTGKADRDGTSSTVRIRVTGSPTAAPTGFITVNESGIIPDTETTLVPTETPGVSEVTFHFTDLPIGTHTLTLRYFGDERYAGTMQDIRIQEDKRRSTRH